MAWICGSEISNCRYSVRYVRASAAGQPDLTGLRVLRGLDGGNEGLVVFEWGTRAALDAHREAVSLDKVAPWAVPLLHWRTDQAYEHEAADAAADSGAG